jgi:hypothetical protein
MPSFLVICDQYTPDRKYLLGHCTWNHREARWEDAEDVDLTHPEYYTYGLAENARADFHRAIQAAGWMDDFRVNEVVRTY